MTATWLNGTRHSKRSQRVTIPDREGPMTDLYLGVSVSGFGHKKGASPEAITDRIDVIDAKANDAIERSAFVDLSSANEWRRIGQRVGDGDGLEGTAKDRRMWVTTGGRHSVPKP